MADFDPDKYLAETSVDKNEFNPDAYLAEGEKKKDVSPSKSVGGTSKSMAEAVGFEAPSTSEEKIKVPYVNQIKQSNIVKHDLAKSDLLKQGMAKDLIASPSPIYKERYIKTLVDKGYDKDQLESFAAAVENNQPHEEPIIKTPMSQTWGALQPIADWSNEFAVKTGEAILGGAEKFKKGVEDILGGLGSQAGGVSQKAQEVTRGTLEMATGATQAAFNVIPAAVEFNIAADAIKTAANKNLSPETAKTVENVLDTPFTMVSKLTNAMGIKPEEGSNSAMVLELLDFAAAAGAMHGAGKVKSEIKSQIKSIKDLKDISQKVAENRATPEEKQSFENLQEGLKKVNITDIKNEAEKSDTPASKEIINKINTVEEKTAPNNDKLQTELAEMQSAFEKLPEGEAKDMLYQQIDFKEQEIAEANRTDADRQLVEAKLNADNAVTTEDLTARIERLQEDKKNVPVVYKSVHDILDTQINELTQQKDAIQKQSTTSILPYPQEGAGITGGERIGMGQGEQRIAPTEEGKTEQAQIKEVKETTNTDEYSNAIASAKEELAKDGKRLDLQVSDVSKEDAQKIVDEGGKLFMTEDGMAGGYVKKDGYMGGLFKNPLSKLKNVSKVLQQARLKVGGKFFDAFGTHLEDMYIKNGFKPVARLKFNEEYAPKGWDNAESVLKNKPDVVFFAYDPKGEAVKGEGKYFDDYDEAYKFAKEHTPAKEVLTEAKAEKITPEEVKVEKITPTEKSKYSILKLKESHGTLKENEKAQLEELKAKAGQKEVIEKTKAQVDNVVAALKKVSPGLKVETHETPEAFAKAAEKAGGKAQESIVAGGFYDSETKTIHLNLEKIQSNTLFHEGVHPILNAIHAVDPKAVDRLFNQVVEAERRAGKEGFYSKEFASAYDEAQQKMEAVTEFIADVADGKIKVTERNFDKIKQIFVDMMKAVGVDLSGKIKTVGELKALADKISTGFEKGEEIRVRKGVGNKSILGIQYQKFGGYEKKGFEESDDYQKLKKLGYINEDFDIHTMQGKPVVVINPDNMITGKILTKEGKTILEGNGGIHFVSKFGDVWASSDKSTANTLARYINEQRALDIKNGGDGTVHIVVTKGSLGKSLTSHNGAKGAMVVLEDFIDKGLIPLKDFRKALTEAGKKQGIDFDGRLDAKSIHEDISKKFFGVTDSSFRGRGFFVNDVISSLAKNSDAVHNNIEKIREELNSKALGRKITFGEAGMKDALGNLFADQMTEGVPNSHAYATIEVNSPVKVELGKHESYPFHIKQENGERPKLNILSKTEHIKEIANPIEGSTNLGSNQVGMAKASIKGEPSLQMQKPRQEITSLNINGKDVEVKETQPDVVNGFYSPLEKVIADSKFDKLPVKQWIEKFAKGEEAKWTGLTDWLSKQEGSVSKADIQQYLKDNRISIVEVEKGKGGNVNEIIKDNTYNNIQDELSRRGIKDSENIIDDWYYKDADWSDVERFLDNNNIDVDNVVEKSKELQDDTKFSQYQLEGEKNNYKEVLVTMPSKQVMSFEEFAVDHWGDISDLTENQKKIARQQYDNYYSKTNKAKAGFKSSHFDEPNILVHLRMNTRTDAQGNKVLFLEEVQSDWGQTGKKEGFTKQISKPIKTEEEVNEEDSLIDKEAKEKFGLPFANIPMLEEINTPEARDLIRRINLNTQDFLALDQEGRGLLNKGIPTAPFVTDTNAWTKLGLKVALKEAVKQGADKIAWTTGEQQNERYDLSQTIKNIDAKLDQTSASDNSPVYKITSKYKSGEETSGSYKESELEGVVGKELAEKIINNKGGKYEGIDLKVGGKGMKGFYGSPTEGSLGIVGNVAKSLFKQEPKTVSIEAEESFNVYDNKYGKLQGNFADFNSAKEFAKKIDGNVQKTTTSTQHSIDITPELKASVSQGQPLFQKPRKGTDLVESAGKRKEMTEDDKGNYLFFHYSDAKFNNLNPEKVGTHLATSRGESPLVKSSMLYTRPDRLEPNVPNRNGYIVKVAKDKVYDFNSDPLKLLPEAEKLFRKENGKDKAFDLNNQVAYVAKVASKEGYPVTVSDWNIKGTKALRAQTVEKLPVEKYQGVKEGTYNQIETNPKYENIKPNAKRRDIQYSKGEEDLNTIFGNAEATAKSHSIEKGLQELESSDYYKKQPKESQQELTEYFKERVGAEEKGTTIDKFNALDKIAEEFKKGNVTKEFRNQKKAIFEENPEIEHVEKNFSKITKQLEENKDFKKSSPECP